jgi:hypothetical protein
MRRNLADTGWNWPFIFGWLVILVVLVLFWAAVLWGVAQLIAGSLHAGQELETRS